MGAARPVVTLVVAIVDFSQHACLSNWMQKALGSYGTRFTYTFILTRMQRHDNFAQNFKAQRFKIKQFRSTSLNSIPS